MKKKTSVSVVALFAVIASPVLLADSTMIFTGVDTSDSSTFSYIGAVHAVNGDLDQRGWLLKGMLSTGEYDYTTTATNDEVNADKTAIQANIGHQWVAPNSRLSLYAGIDHQDIDLSPNDPENSTQGSETGAQMQGELSATGSAASFGLMANISSSNDSYWSRGRFGYRINRVSVGPEVSLMGNNEYEEERYGLFVNVPVSDAISVNLSGGYFDVDGDNTIRDNDGSYLSMGIGVGF